MIFFDFEVFLKDWMVVILDMDAQEEHVIVNDPDRLKAFYEAHKNDIWCGFNVVHYDQYIFKAILLDMNPKEVNDHIVVKDKAGWSYSNLFRQIKLVVYDIMLRTDKGLKTFEGFLGHNIKESDVDFNIRRKLTAAEIAETVKYCRHDVEETVEVFLRRKEEFEAQMFFIKHFKYPLTDLSLTKAQLAAKMLGANGKGHNFDDEFQFPIVDCLRLTKYKHIADWYRNPENHDYSKSQKNVIVAGVPHNFSWGGGHGALLKYHAKGIFLIIDVTAYYPSMQKQYKFGYRVMNNPENFEFIHDSNIAFKRAGDKKKRQPFKIFDNAISGQMKQPSSKLYDPMSNNSICINGQLMLLDLVEHLEPYVKLLQNNTDGILMQLMGDYDETFQKIDDIVYDWEQRTGMKMDFDEFRGEVFQKDVNNYLLVDHETGACKAKGAYLKKLSDLDCDLLIVNEALNAFMKHGIPVEQTIMGCDELKPFQMVRKASSKYEGTYHGGWWEKRQGVNPATGRMKTFDHFVGERKKLNERCVRIFASTRPQDGGVWKKKGDRFEKMEDSPEHSFIWNDEVNGVSCPAYLDKRWYVNLAKKRLKDFGVNV